MAATVAKKNKKKRVNERSTETNRDNEISREMSHVQKLHTIERL